MASDMTKLSQSQKIVVDKIIAIGREMGASDRVIQAAVNFGNAESDFDYLKVNPSNSDVMGMFQYKSATWAASWDDFKTENPSDPLALLSASQVRKDEGAQIKVMIQDLMSTSSNQIGFSRSNLISSTTFIMIFFVILSCSCARRDSFLLQNPETKEEVTCYSGYYTFMEGSPQMKILMQCLQACARFGFVEVLPDGRVQKFTPKKPDPEYLDQIPLQCK